jgi:predicted Zn finger-like uncharacterized protein
MDVRCEKCLTVYEFDDAQVGPAGVTVKCTQCGNLFKVKKKDATPAPGPAPERPKRTTSPFGVVQRPSNPAPSAPVPVPPIAAPPSRPPDLHVRLVGSGQTYRCADLRTLEQWVAERKVSREDQMTRDGQNWVALGGLAELRGAFALVDQSEANARAQEEQANLALSTTAPMKQPPAMPRGGGHESGPISMGDGVDDDDPAFATTNRTPRISQPLPIPKMVDELADLDVEPRSNKMPMIIGGVVLLLAIGGVGAFLALRKPAVSPQKGQQTFTDGRAQFLLDTDDGFRRAAALFEQARGADGSNARVLGALAELKSTWAFYLREDARGLDGGGAATASVAKSLRRDAQAYLDEAKKHAADALALEPDGAEVNRAMADFLRVDGGPLAEAERYLKRALDKNPADGETLFVAGALAMREGKLDEARVKLEQANQKQPLARALFLLGRMGVTANQKEIARQHLKALVALSPDHERGKTLLASLDAVAAADLGVRAADLAPAVAQAPGGSKEATPEELAALASKGGGGDYNKIVAQADKLSENGKADPARKLYEKALTLQPNGVEALTGLGYCDLDKERFLGAVDHFKKALAASPDYGEALIGLAESYKVRGDKTQAIEYYKRYLKAQPSGSKATMAQKNLRDLEPRDTAKPVEKAVEKPVEKPEEKREETSLPKPPPVDEPPPP